MKTIIGAILAVVVIGGGYILLRPEAAPEALDRPVLVIPNAPEGWKVYTVNDPAGSIAVSYPSEAEARLDFDIPTQEWRVGATKANGALLADIRIPKSFMPGTNFSDARFTIGRSADADEIRNCLAVQDNFSERENVTIGDHSFIKTTFADAAAGNRYDTTSYRTILDGDCYVVEYTIHSTAIGNYPPEAGITEFDKAKITDTLERMTQSVRLLIASD